MNDLLTKFDTWLTDDGPAALVVRQNLQSVEGPDAVVFPPTYAAETAGQKGDYNIDYFRGTFAAKVAYQGPGQERLETDVRHEIAGNVCLVNSVGAEANRVEILFRPDQCDGRYSSLVPQITIQAGNQSLNLLDAGHRAGDAIVRFTTIGEAVWNAFQALLNENNAEPLAKIAPTSIVFGVWDSRGTQAKMPRVFRSVVRAYNVRRNSRSAQYNRATKYVENGIIKEELDKGTGDQNPLSREGFKDSPAGNTHGGVLVEGDIRREMTVNLTAIRRLRVPDSQDQRRNDPDRTRALRRYILGLSLVAATAKNPERFDLREGCQLRIQPGHKPTWKLVPFDGDDQPLPDLEPTVALEYAKLAAAAFGVDTTPRSVRFDEDAANKWLALDGKEQDKRRRQNPMTKQFEQATGGPGPQTAATAAQPKARGRRGQTEEKQG